MTNDTGEAERGLRIHRLRAENVLRLEVVEIVPDEHRVIIGGKNGAGKSSVLNAIAMVIGGGKHVPEKVLREGEKRGKVVLDVGPFRLTRTWSRNDNGRLKIEAKEGQDAPTAQRLLDKLYDAIAFDPFAWARLGETKAGQKKQREDLLKVARVPIDLDGNLRDRAARYDERRMVGRERDKLRGAVESRPLIEAPKERVELTPLLDEFQQAAKARAEVRSAEREAERAKARAAEVLTYVQERTEAFEARIAQAQRSHEEWLRQIEEQKRQREDEIRRLERELPQAQEGWAEQVTEAEQAAEQAHVHLKELAAAPDTDEIQRRIDEAKEANRRFEQAQERRDLEAELENAEANYEELSGQIERLDEERTEALKQAALPVDGLGFDEDGVVYHGMPFAQLAQSERLRISIAMAMALNKPENGGAGLKVMLCRDGALFDQEHLALVCQLAKDKDYQLWIETVGEDEACSVVMEEGRVRDADTA